MVRDGRKEESISTRSITALAGGVGAARFLRGLATAVPPETVTVIGNTGDDALMYGLHVSPDLDIVTYTLAGIVDRAGWGIAGDTTNALEQMAAYGVETWFTLRDRDIGTSMARTAWLAAGVPLSEVADRVRRGLGVGARILPMSDEPVSTRIVTLEGSTLEFQEYFVKNRHADQVAAVVFEGAGEASPAPGVLKAIQEAEVLVVCPSNPVLSIGPILAVPGIREALAGRRSDVVAISPIVGGRALKGPAANLLPVVGAEPSAAGVAGLYRDFCATMVLDEIDGEQAGAIEELGMRAVVAQTVMHTPADAEVLAKQVLAL
ncbi:MAG TPA: 2-phospho-L-lactate transferase [Actinomycetota bacterium]|nr:2-phospho-L-lactate transferase [Actinomycetota bacterium]